MESACRAAAKRIRFRTPRRPHSITDMVLTLTLYTKYPDVVGDAINIYLFPDLSL